MPGRETVHRRPWIEHLWFRRARWYEMPLWIGLVPASLAYGAAQSVRNAFWRIARRRPGVRTVSVGNLTVGGNGKTPFTLFLASRMAAHGFSAAVASRGFGRRRMKRARLVSDGREIKLSPEEAGDEPVMMAKSFAGPIAVARRRIDAVRLLKDAFNPDVVILDDAFQHAALARDVDLVLVNRERGLGNGWRLPAGPMREKLRAVRRASAVILMSSASPNQPSALSAGQMKALSRAPVLRAALRPRALVRIENGKWVEEPLAIAGRRVLAVSGLADPSGFYAMLREIGADLAGVLEYPDHHDYTPADWQTIVNAAPDADIVVTTEKDLVKLEKFPFARDSLYALRLEVVMNAEDLAQLDELVIGGMRETAAAAEAV